MLVCVYLSDSYQHRGFSRRRNTEGYCGCKLNPRSIRNKKSAIQQFKPYFTGIPLLWRLFVLKNEFTQNKTQRTTMCGSWLVLSGNQLQNRPKRIVLQLREWRTYDKKSKQAGVLSTVANPNPGSVWSGTDAAVREHQKRDFCQYQELATSSPSKSTFTPKSSL